MKKSVENIESLSRRKFLQNMSSMTARTVILNTGGGFWRSLFKDDAGIVEPYDLGLEDFKVSLCGGCAGGCSIVVRLIDGKAVSIKGNPLYPVNKGRMCPRGLAGLQRLYNPDRIKTPLRRSGHRGDGQWEEISWEQAFGELAKRLNDLKNKRAAHQLVMLTDENDGIDLNIMERFMDAYGSPNFIPIKSGNITSKARRHMYGDVYSVGYDIEPALFR